MQRTEGTFEIAGQSYYVENIFSESSAHKPTIVFLHDALGSVRGWKTFPITLCESIGLNGFLFDRLGHGFSDGYPGSWQKGYMEREAFEVLPAILANFNIRNPILLGISDGGSIALLYASQNSDVTALISIAGHIKVEKKTQIGVAATIQEPTKSKLTSGLKKYHGDGATQLLSRWQSTWTSDSFADWDISNCLGTIKAPSLILQGEDDAYATAQQCYDIASGIGPQAQAHILSDCGHFPTRDKPSITTELIREFLNSFL